MQAGLRFIRELLNDDPGLVHDLHETMRTLLTFANTGSMRVDLGVLGWSAEREKALARPASSARSSTWSGSPCPPTSRR